MPPKLNRQRALFVLTKIDEILAWEQRKETERDTKFVELGSYLCEVRAGQYWRLEKLKSFDEFLEKRFPESRRKAYYLMSIHEHLPPQARKESQGGGLDEGIGVGEGGAQGWAGLRLCNLVAQSPRDAEGSVQARSGKGTDGKGNRGVGVGLFQVVQEPDSGYRAGNRNCGFHARIRQVRGLLPGNDLCGLPRGSESGPRHPETLLFSMMRFFRLLPEDQKQCFPREPQREGFMNRIRLKSRTLTARFPVRTRICGNKCYAGTAGAVSPAAPCQTWRFTINSFAAIRVQTRMRI